MAIGVIWGTISDMSKTNAETFCRDAPHWLATGNILLRREPDHEDEEEEDDDNNEADDDKDSQDDDEGSGYSE